MGDMPAILSRSKNTRDLSKPPTPLDVYIESTEEYELAAINQRQQENLALQREFEGWSKPGNQGIAAVFDSLKRAAGDRGFTFLGRAVTKDMSFDDVLKKIPAGELEEAGTAIKSILSPERYKIQDAVRANIFLTLFNDPFLHQPGGMVKFLRRKSQNYLDPQGEIMQRRTPAGANYWENLRMFGLMLRDKADY